MQGTKETYNFPRLPVRIFHMVAIMSVIWESEKSMNLRFKRTLVFIVYCCMTNYSETSQLNPAKLYISHSTYGLGIWVWLSWTVLARGLCRGCHQAVWQRLPSSEAFCSPEDLPQDGSFIWLLAGSLSTLPHGDSQGCLTVLTTQQLVSPGGKDQRHKERDGGQKPGCLLRFSPRKDIPSFCHILLSHRPILMQWIVGGGCAGHEARIMRHSQCSIPVASLRN